jgi:tungstate transport system substrate-binding protein
MEWVCNHSRNTQLALLYGYIDIALTYERDQEEVAASEGWSRTVGCMFHDHFVLAGPISDPAGIMNVKSLPEALQQIAERKCLFHSRADSSATMWKERSLWEAAQLAPWHLSQDEKWYKQSQRSPAEAVVAASQVGAYLITDRSTLLTQTHQGTVQNITVFIEPETADSILMNSCYALVSTADDGHGHHEERDRFVRYVASSRGQSLIRSFGRIDSAEPSLFAGVEEGFARSTLRGGRPVDRTWKIP